MTDGNDGENHNYVLGFMFSPDLDKVVLIEKNRPYWQKGKLNGVGGHIEPGETPIEAMVREFKEEAGLDIHPENWIHVASMREHGASVMVFACWAAGYANAAPQTDESILIVDPFYIPRRLVVPNLKWLIPMCQWALKKDSHVAIDMHGGLS